MDSIEIITSQFDYGTSEEHHLQSKGSSCSYSSVGENSTFLTNPKMIKEVSKVHLDTLKRNLSDFTSAMDDLFDASQLQSNKKYCLDEIEVSIEISANGSIKLIGSVEVGASSCLKLTFKRSKNA